MHPQGALFFAVSHHESGPILPFSQNFFFVVRTRLLSSPLKQIRRTIPKQAEGPLSVVMVGERDDAKDTAQNTSVDLIANVY